MDASAILKQARARSGLTRSQLARAAGTSQPTLAAYESGAKAPSVRTLDRIVRASGATMEITLREAPALGGPLLEHLRVLAPEIRAAARRRRIRNLRIFGSTARGTETPASDVDLLRDQVRARALAEAVPL